MEDILEDDDTMKAIAKDFAAGTNKSVIRGCVDAIDGWLVCIHKQVGIPNSSKILSRKGYFAIMCRQYVMSKRGYFRNQL